MLLRPLAVFLCVFVGIFVSAPAFARELTPAETALFLDATDLPLMRRGDLPQADDSGPLLGKATWIAADQTDVILIVQELRWVFPDDATADAWLTQNIQALSEGMEAANAPAMGDRSFAFGPEFPNSEALGADMRMINYVFRVGRVIVKFFATSSGESSAQLTPLFVSPFAAKAVDRVREAQKSISSPAIAPVVVAAPPPVAPEPQPEPSPAPAEEGEQESDDVPVSIVAYGGAQGMLFGRYLRLTNLLNQPDRTAATAGVRFAFPLFSNGTEETTGFGLHDSLELEVEGGLRLSEAFQNSNGEEESMFAAGYGASYSLAIGYRWEPLGILVGARPTARGVLLGGATSGGVDLPLMALVELRPSDDVLIAARGHYSFFFDQQMAGLMAAAFFDEEWFLRFDYDQYRMSASVPAYLGEERIKVGRQVTTSYAVSIGGLF